jgi:hypothetical protein
MYYIGEARSPMKNGLEIRGLFFAGSLAQHLFPVMDYKRQSNRYVL